MSIIIVKNENLLQVWKGNLININVFNEIIESCDCCHYIFSNICPKSNVKFDSNTNYEQVLNKCPFKLKPTKEYIFSLNENLEYEEYFNYFRTEQDKNDFHFEFSYKNDILSIKKFKQAEGICNYDLIYNVNLEVTNCEHLKFILKTFKII